MSAQPRFYVVALEGYEISPLALTTAGGGRQATLTLSVLDRFNCHREVARFTPRRSYPGATAARLAAEARVIAAERAAYLNAWHEREAA